MSLWYSPHPKAFLREICQVVGTEREHCAVSIPQHLIPSFREELLSYGRKSLGELQVLQLNPQVGLWGNLAPLFNIDAGGDKKLSDLPEMTLPRCRNLVIFPSEKPLSWEEEFLAFVDTMAAHAKYCKDQGKRMLWSMLIVIPAGSKMPHEDIGLRVLYWWGRLHVSDLEYAIESNFGASEAQEYHLYCWFYALCKGVASGDPRLVELFQQQVPIDVDSLVNALAGHELCTEENARLVMSYLNSSKYSLTRDVVPQGIAAELWHCGILDFDCYGKPSLHPAALVAAQKIDVLERLVVKGQMQVYLPLVQEVHEFLYNKIECLLGYKWDGRNKKSFSSIKSEIGPFSVYINRRFKDVLPKDILREALEWRDLRNSIAHAQMIPFDMAVSRVMAYQKLLRNE